MATPPGPADNRTERTTALNCTLQQLAGMIDHSLLNPTFTDADLERGIQLALEYNVASVCIMPYYLRRCAVCFLKGLCEQCPAKSWAEYGTLDTPVEYLCNIAHAQAQYLGLVGDGEKAWEVAEGDWRVRLAQFSGDNANG